MEEEISEKKILFWREFMISHMNNLAIFPLLMAYLALFSKDVSVALFLWIPMGFVPFAFYLLRMRCSNFLTLLLSHIFIAAASVVFYWTTPCRDFCLITAIGYFLYSLVVHVRTFDQLDGSISVIAATGFSVIVSLVIAVEKDTVLGSFDKMIAAALILYYGFYFFSGFIEKFCNFLVVSKNSAGHIPKDEIFHSGIKMVSGSVGCIVVLLFLAADIQMIKNLIQGVRNLMISMIRALLRLLSMKDAQEDVTYFQEELIRPQMPDLPAGQSYHGVFWEIVTMIAALFVAVSLISFLVYALKKVIKFFRHKTGREKLKFTESPDVIFEDIRESCRTEHGKTGLSFPELKPLFLLSPNEKIRRFYKHFIKRNMELLKPSDPVFLTAKESVHLLSRDRMAVIYEKARYSGEECTNFDYTLIKELSRHEDETAGPVNGVFD